MSCHSKPKMSDPEWHSVVSSKVSILFLKTSFVVYKYIVKLCLQCTNEKYRFKPDIVRVACLFLQRVRIARNAERCTS